MLSDVAVPVRLAIVTILRIADRSLNKLPYIMYERGTILTERERERAK